MWCEGCYFNWGAGHKARGIITADPRQAQAWAHIQGGGAVIRLEIHLTYFATCTPFEIFPPLL